MKITVDWLKENNACKSAVVRGEVELDGGLPLSEVIQKLDRADWLIWLLHKTGTCNHLQLVKLACICARRALRFVPKGDERPLKTIQASEAWIENPCKETADAARRAADAAPYTAFAAPYAAFAVNAPTCAAFAVADAAFASDVPLYVTEQKAMCWDIRRELKKENFKKLSCDFVEKHETRTKGMD